MIIEERTTNSLCGLHFSVDTAACEVARQNSGPFTPPAEALAMTYAPSGSTPIPVAAIGPGGSSNSDLYVKERVLSGGMPKSGVAYLDNVVYTRDGAAGYAYLYANIVGADIEGKITNDASPIAKFYYIKDHLGSTRTVINQDGSGNAAFAEVTWYKPYGRPYLTGLHFSEGILINVGGSEKIMSGLNN
jgi:hypothetical protein